MKQVKNHNKTVDFRYKSGYSERGGDRMLPDNLAVIATDALNFHQKKERIFQPARSFSAITLRRQTAGKYFCKGKPIPFEPACICIVPEGVAYERSTLEEDILVIHFHLLNYAMEEVQVFRVSDAEKYEALFTKALRLKYENNAGSVYLVTAVLYEILAELTRDVGFATDPKDNRIITSAESMRQHFADPGLSIEALAKQACVSPAYYRREFRRLYGTSPKEYLDTLRINYAKSLLETGYFSQKEIAARCGFLDVGYFRTMFRKKIGKSMRQYLLDPTKNDY